jgi:hypothetical protein
LLVSLSEIRRVDGKVRQDHIADLGAIDGIMLPSFYSKLDAETAEAVRRTPAWRHGSSPLSNRWRSSPRRSLVEIC